MDFQTDEQVRSALSAMRDQVSAYSASERFRSMVGLPADPDAQLSTSEWLRLSLMHAAFAVPLNDAPREAVLEALSDSFSDDGTEMTLAARLHCAFEHGLDLAASLRGLRQQVLRLTLNAEHAETMAHADRVLAVAAVLADEDATTLAEHGSDFNAAHYALCAIAQNLIDGAWITDGVDDLFTQLDIAEATTLLSLAGHAYGTDRLPAAGAPTTPEAS